MKKTGRPVRTGVVLGIETATALGGVALVSAAGELLGEITLRNNESHAERVLPAAAGLLETHGLTPRDLAAVSVSRGPGSFTGLRAGVAAAKGLALSLEVPLYGIPTLESLAANVPPGEELVCAVLAARRGEVFRAFFSSGPQGPRRRGDDELVTIERLAAELPARCLVVGAMPGLTPRPQPPGLRFCPDHLNHPRAAVIALLGWQALCASRVSDLATLLPSYLRAPDAEAARGPTEIARAGGQLQASSLTPPAPSASIGRVPTGRRRRDR